MRIAPITGIKNSCNSYSIQKNNFQINKIKERVLKADTISFGYRPDENSDLAERSFYWKLDLQSGLSKIYEDKFRNIERSAENVTEKNAIVKQLLACPENQTYPFYCIIPDYYDNNGGFDGFYQFMESLKSDNPEQKSARYDLLMAENKTTSGNITFADFVVKPLLMTSNQMNSNKQKLQELVESVASDVSEERKKKQELLKRYKKIQTSKNI